MAARMARLWLVAPLVLGPVEGATAPAAAKTGTSKNWASKNWASGTFIYADLCTERGGRIGRRITLRRSPNGDALFYEAAVEGPVRIETVAFEDETRSVSFVHGTDRGPVTFRGRIEGGVLSGTFADAEGTHDVRLPRVLRTHADPPCRDRTTASVAAGR